MLEPLSAASRLIPSSCSGVAAILRNNPQWQELIPHLKQLRIEVETQEVLPLWDDAAAEYVRKLKASRIGRDVPIITVSQEFDEAFPAMVRWIKAQGRIEIGFQEGQGFVVRALDEDGILSESQDGQSGDKALTTLEQRIAQAGLPVGPVSRIGATQRPKSRSGSGKAAGATARSTHKVSVPISAAERRLILGAAHLDDEIVDRLEQIASREDLVSLTISELVRLAIATAGDPNRLANESDRNLWRRLSDRLHEAVGDCLRSDRS